MAADDIDAQFLPAEDELSPDADLAAAEASALEDPFSIPVAEDAPVPFGRTWFFDWDRGRFIRHGSAPAEARGDGALIQWCQMALRSAWMAHRVFSPEFGIERPDSPIGLSGAEAEAEAADWAARAREALLVHDRIVEVEGLSVRLLEDAIYFGPFTVVTDESDSVVVGPLTIREEG